MNIKVTWKMVGELLLFLIIGATIRTLYSPFIGTLFALSGAFYVISKNRK